MEMCKDRSQSSDKIQSIDDFIHSYETENSHLKEIIEALLKTVNFLQASNHNDQKSAAAVTTQSSLLLQNDELKRKITVLDDELERTVQKDVREIEEYKEIIFDMQQVIADTTLIYNERIKTLEEEIIALKNSVAAAAGNDSVELKKESSDEAEKDEGFIESKNEYDAGKVEIDNNFGTSNEVVKGEDFVELKDAIVDGEIDYEKLKGKILVVNKLYTGENYCCAVYGEEEKSIEIQLNGSYKLHLNGSYVHEGGPSITNLLKYVHSCSLHSLSLADCNLSFRQFLTFAYSKTVEYLELRNVTVNNTWGFPSETQVVSLEKILKYFPNLKGLTIWCAKQSDPLDLVFGYGFCRKKTALYLLNLPLFENLQTFNLYHCPHNFDLATFGEFINKHYWAKFKISIFVYFHDRPQWNASHAVVDKFRADKDAIMNLWLNEKPEILFEFHYPDGIKLYENPYLPRSQIKLIKPQRRPTFREYFDF